MLTHELIERLRSLRLTGMAEALDRQLTQPATHEELSFEQRLALLVDTEVTARENRRIDRGLRIAKLRYRASVHDIDYRHRRGLKKAHMASLIQGDWLHKHHGLLITGQTGTGKSWLACALGDNACRLGFTVRYFRASRLFKALEIARGDGSYAKQLIALARTDLLILDDFALEPLAARHRNDLLEIMEDRYGERATLVTSQIPVQHWHKAIGEPTLADAILDRLVHNAHRLELDGETMRAALETNS